MVRMRLALTHLHDYGVQVVKRNSLIKAACECAPSKSGLASVNPATFSKIDLRAHDQTTCLELVAELEHRGFIRKTRVDGVFAVVKDQKALTDARSQYLDPLARILDYVRAILSRSVEGSGTPVVLSSSNP